MKKQFFLLPLLLITILHVTSCNDDSQPALPRETVLSKVFNDGKLELEYYYDENRKLEQIREYDLVSGLLDYHSEFHYDSRGYLQEEITYNSDEKPVNIRKYLKNGDGQFVRGESISLTGSDSGKVSTVFKYQYNKQGFISKESWNDPDTDSEESFMSYFYFPNGNLERYEYYWTLKSGPEKVVEAQYSAVGDTLPQHLNKHRVYPMNLNLYRFVAEEIKYVFFDSEGTPVSVYREVFDKRIYNSEGFITEQTMTTQYIDPEKPDDVTTKKYEYMEI